MNTAHSKLSRVLEWHDAWAVKSRIIVLALLYPLFPAILLPWIGDVGGAPILDLHFTYNAETVQQVLSQYDASAMENYRLCALTVDLVYPFYYAFLMSLLFAYSLKSRYRHSSPMQLLRLLPVVMMLVDWSENLILVSIIDQWPQLDQGLANVAGFITLSKWGMLMVIVATLCCLALAKFGFARARDAD